MPRGRPKKVKEVKVKVERRKDKVIEAPIMNASAIDRILELAEKIRELKSVIPILAKYQIHRVGNLNQYIEQLEKKLKELE